MGELPEGPGAGFFVSCRFSSTACCSAWLPVQEYVPLPRTIIPWNWASHLERLFPAVRGPMNS